MGLLALIFGFIGGLCAVVGITTAVKIVPQFGTELTWMFWLVVSVIMLLISIALAVGRGEGYD